MASGSEGRRVCNGVDALVGRRRAQRIQRQGVGVAQFARAHLGRRRSSVVDRRRRRSGVVARLASAGGNEQLEPNAPSLRSLDELTRSRAYSWI